MNEEFNSTENSPQETEDLNKKTNTTQPSFLDKIFPNFHLSLDILNNTKIFVVIIVICVLFFGSGTYFITTNLFKTKSDAPHVSSMEDGNLPEFPSSNTNTTIITPLVTFTPTPTSPPTPKQTTPVPTTSQTANWTQYNFAALFLNFSYPPGWFINYSPTSAAPYLYVQNYSTSTVPTTISGNYSIFIGRLEQVGITTISALQTQLALNAANNTYFGSTNMGTTTVVTSEQTTINGYLALERTVTYSSSPSTEYYEVYVLDGISNVVKFSPLMDITGTIPYLNTLLTTVQFTN